MVDRPDQNTSCRSQKASIDLNLNGRLDWFSQVQVTRGKLVGLGLDIYQQDDEHVAMVIQPVFNYNGL